MVTELSVKQGSVAFATINPETLAQLSFFPHSSKLPLTSAGHEPGWGRQEQASNRANRRLPPQPSSTVLLQEGSSGVGWSICSSALTQALCATLKEGLQGGAGRKEAGPVDLQLCGASTHSPGRAEVTQATGAKQSDQLAPCPATAKHSHACQGPEALAQWEHAHVFSQAGGPRSGEFQAYRDDWSRRAWILLSQLVAAFKTE